jgi:hypothetical protein
MSFLKLRPVLFALVLCGLASSVASAGYVYRQYYSSYRYHSSQRYYYSNYYYQPTYNYSGYRYHYAIYYPSQPRYVYYYNPYKRVYWGRFDLQGCCGQQYSLLAENDRKEQLKEIPESAFPKPGPMPKVPEATDGTTMLPPPAELPVVAPSTK